MNNFQSVGPHSLRCLGLTPINPCLVLMCYFAKFSGSAETSHCRSKNFIPSFLPSTQNLIISKLAQCSFAEDFMPIHPQLFKISCTQTNEQINKQNDRIILGLFLLCLVFTSLHQSQSYWLLL